MSSLQAVWVDSLDDPRAKGFGRYPRPACSRLDPPHRPEMNRVAPSTLRKAIASLSFLPPFTWKTECLIVFRPSVCSLSDFVIDAVGQAQTIPLTLFLDHFKNYKIMARSLGLDVKDIC